jgi:hypothetical protein
MGLPQDVSANAGLATPTTQSDEDVNSKPHKWYYYLWDTLDKPKEERWFMFKLDAALLTFASLGIVPRGFSCYGSATKPHHRLLHQISRSDEHQQRVCVWNVCTKENFDLHQASLLISSAGKKTLGFTAISSITCKHAGP